MHSRTRARVLFALCLITAFFVLPAVALAMPSVDVSGTVTAAATGAKLQGIRVEVYMWEWAVAASPRTVAMIRAASGCGSGSPRR